MNERKKPLGGKEKLAGWLKLTGVTRKALADYVGVTETSVRNWTKGRSTPNRDAAARLEEKTAGIVAVADWLS